MSITPSEGQLALSGYLAAPGSRAAVTRRHDHGLALWRFDQRRVELVRVWELERLTGQKHHYSPLADPADLELLLAALLAEEGAALEDVAVSWGTPGLPRYAPFNRTVRENEVPVHALAHLYSGILMNSELYREADQLGLAVDGAPDFTIDARALERWYAGAVSRRGRLTWFDAESPAMLFSAARRLTGLEPGSLMALATATDVELDASVLAPFDQVRLLGGEGHRDVVETVLVSDLFTEAKRQVGGTEVAGFSRREIVWSAAMKAVQELGNRAMDRNVARAVAATGIRPEDTYLSVTGGFALNCPTNTSLLDRHGFLGLRTPPWPSDSGQPVGLGLMGMVDLGVLPTAEVRLDTPYVGRPLRDATAALDDLADWVLDVTTYNDDQFCADIQGDVVAWAIGEAEVGPRALGHRSLLGDPRRCATRDRLNEVKQRQWWRPVAPVVLAENMRDWFELDRNSPFMLEAAKVTERCRELAPAVVHLDGTARVQTVRQDDDPRLRRALLAFHRATGLPLLCNTSLNDRGEPIVDTAREALLFCIRKGVTVCYIDNARIALRADAQVSEGPPDRPWATHWTRAKQSYDQVWRDWVDRGYPPEVLYLMSRRPEMASLPYSRVAALADQLLADPATRRRAEGYARAYGPQTPFRTSFRSYG